MMTHNVCTYSGHGPKLIDYMWPWCHPPYPTISHLHLARSVWKEQHSKHSSQTWRRQAVRQVSYGIRYMDSLTKRNRLPACLINGTQTVCIHTGQGPARPRFSRKLQTGSHSPYPHPRTKWPCLCYNHAGWVTSFRYRQKNQSVDLPSGIAGAELELTQSKIKVRPVSKCAHISPLTCQLPYLEEPACWNL